MSGLFGVSPRLLVLTTFAVHYLMVLASAAAASMISEIRTYPKGTKGPAFLSRVLLSNECRAKFGENPTFNGYQYSCDHKRPEHVSNRNVQWVLTVHVRDDRTKL